MRLSSLSRFVMPPGWRSRVVCVAAEERRLKHEQSCGCPKTRGSSFTALR